VFLATAKRCLKSAHVLKGLARQALPSLRLEPAGGLGGRWDEKAPDDVALDRYLQISVIAFPFGSS
jgi:hypothetical protein